MVLKIVEKLKNNDIIDILKIWHITMLIIVLQELYVYHLLDMCLFDFMEY
jgi:hypothetical protein